MLVPNRGRETTQELPFKPVRFFLELNASGIFQTKCIVSNVVFLNSDNSLCSVLDAFSSDETGVTEKSSISMPEIINQLVYLGCGQCCQVIVADKEGIFKCNDCPVPTERELSEKGLSIIKYYFHPIQMQLRDQPNAEEEITLKIPSNLIESIFGGISAKQVFESAESSLEFLNRSDEELCWDVQNLPSLLQFLRLTILIASPQNSPFEFTVKANVTFNDPNGVSKTRTFELVDFKM
jgi:hypothetical protein